MLSVADIFPSCTKLLWNDEKVVYHMVKKYFFYDNLKYVVKHYQRLPSLNFVAGQKKNLYFNAQWNIKE